MNRQIIWIALLPICLVFVATPRLGAVSIPLVVDSHSPTGASSVTIEIIPDSFLFSRSSDSSSISGTAVIDLTPGTAPFTRAQITELDLLIDESLKFRLGLGLSASADQGEISLSMISPGPPASVHAGRFDQPDNIFSAAGTVDISLYGPINLSTLDPSEGDLTGLSLSQTGDQISLSAPVSVEQQTVIPDIPFIGDVPITFRISGNVLATGTAVYARCDFNRDGNCNLTDMNRLFAQGDLTTGTVAGAAPYDLDNNRKLDQTDIDLWLDLSAETNGYGSIGSGRNYRRGDTDGLGTKSPAHRDVDITDFNALADHFDDTGDGNPNNGPFWNQGNFDGDDDIDITDFNFLASNFAAAGYAGSLTVPEPSSLVLSALGLLAMIGWIFSRQRR